MNNTKFIAVGSNDKVIATATEYELYKEVCSTLGYEVEDDEYMAFEYILATDGTVGKFVDGNANIGEVAIVTLEEEGGCRIEKEVVVSSYL